MPYPVILQTPCVSKECDELCMIFPISSHTVVSKGYVLIAAPAVERRGCLSEEVYGH